jgi:hypothetical protein
VVQEQTLIDTNLLDTPITTPQFTLASVNAETGLGADNIVTLRGTDFSADGGGSWMGIDYVKVNGATLEQPKFLTSTVSSGKINLTWSGTGGLEWAPAVNGPWTPVTPAPSGSYSEAIVAGQDRFFRLHTP